MLRKIIQIDTEKCNGCGLCARACHEGAIGMEDGKAKLLRDDYCDGLGDCLLACPVDAISFTVREAAAYDEAAVLERKRKRRQWPVQLRLAPLEAPCFQNVPLLIAADCTAYAYADFHRDFMGGKATLVGCPKLDPVDYAEKLTEIIKRNEITEILVARMEVPCCGGIERAVKQAVKNSGKTLPCKVATISVDGNLIR